MAAEYPGAIFTAMTRGPLMSDPTTQSDFVEKLQEELRAALQTLGVNPQGALATVATRLAAMSETPQTWNVTSITQGGSVSCTTTSGTGYYQRHDGLFTAGIEVVIAGTGTAGTAISIPTPLTLSNLRNVHGTYVFLDASDSSRAFSGVVQQNTTTTFQLAATGLDAGAVTGNALGLAQFTAAVAAGDAIRIGIQGRYA